MKKNAFSFLVVTFFIAACGGIEPTPVRTTPNLPSPTQTVPVPERILLSADALTNGFEFERPMAESALNLPAEVAPATHTFEGRLELLGEKENGQIDRKSVV